MFRRALLGLASISALLAQEPPGTYIDTFVGTDWTFQADGQQALNAPLGQTDDVALDAAGNLYIADSLNLQVYRVSPDGILRILAGNGFREGGSAGPDARNVALEQARSIALGPDGSVFIGEITTIRRVAPDGSAALFAGGSSAESSGDGGPALNAGFELPLGLVTDRDGSLYFCTLSRVRRIGPDGIIRTVVGNGEAGFAGDGGPATEASINTCEDLAFDAAGNLYIADTGNHRVRKVTPQGIISTVAGGGQNTQDGGYPATQAELHIPHSLTFDSAGNLYVAESERLRRIDPAGIITTAAGGGFGFSGDGGPARDALFNTVSGLAADASGNLFLADSHNARIRRINAAGIINTVAGNGQYRAFPEGTPAQVAFIKSALYVAVSPDGSLYYSDIGDLRIRRVDEDARVFTAAGTGEEFGHDVSPVDALTTAVAPYGLTFDAVGTLYFAEGGRIRRLSPDGSVTVFAAEPGAEPRGLTSDGAGNLYFTDPFFHRVGKVSPAGVITTLAGTGEPGFQDGPGNTAQFNGPGGIAADAAGVVYVADSGNHRIRKITPDGTVSTFAGSEDPDAPLGDGGPALAAAISPGGLAFDATGALLVTDGVRLRRITPDGIIRTIAGGEFGFSGDGGLAINAKFRSPGSLAVDREGNVFITDPSNFRIRTIPVNVPQSGPVSLMADPDSLSFAVEPGGGRPPVQQVAVTGATGTSFSIQVSDPFLVATSSGSVTPATVSVTVDPAGLAPGSYEGTIRLIPLNADVLPAVIPVSVRIQRATLSADTQGVSFSFPVGAPADSRKVAVSNTGGGAAPFHVTAETKTGGAWLTASPAEGTAVFGSPVPLAITANPAGLAPNTYTGAVTIAGDSSTPVVIAITMIVNNSQPVLLSQSGLTFQAVAGGGASPPQTIRVFGAAVGPFSFTAEVIVAPGLPSWLAVTPSQGSGNSGQSVPLTVSVNPAGLAAGDYFGRVQVSSSANPPRVATIVLRVLPTGSNPGPFVQPTGLVFTGVAGGPDPSSQTFTVTNLTADPYIFGSGAATLDGGDYIQYKPISASVPLGSLRVVVQPSFSGLAAGVYRGAITLVFGDGAIRTVAILIVIAPAGTTLDGARSASGCTATQLLPLVTTLAEGFRVPASFPAAIEVRVVDDCGEPLRSGSVISRFDNGDPPLSLATAGDGIWSGTWVNRNTAARDVTITATAEDAQRQLKGTARITGGLNGEASPPVIGQGGVVSAASLAGQAPLAPGAMVSVFGAGLASGAAAAPALPLGDELAGASVVVGGRLAPLLYSSSGQINAILPYGLPVNSRVQMVVTQGGEVSLPEEITIAPAQPAVFSVNGSGKGQGHIYVATPAGLVLAAPGAPAKAGDVLIVYAAGLGQVDQPLVEGTISPSDPLARTVNPVTVTIGGVPAAVAFAGLAPGFAGLYQLNVVVPGGVSSGDDVLLVVTAAGQSSPPVTLAVR